MGGPREVDATQKLTFSEIYDKAYQRALGGGLTGAAAMGVQVGTLMWMRTTMNYQYRYGTGMTQAIKTLYKEGGVPRFYRGVGFALFQGPMSRFGDTAANAGAITILNNLDETKDLPIAVKTSAASLAAGLFRIGIMPIDTCKTIMQVEGKKGLQSLAKKVRVGGPTVMFHGSLGAASATAAGHYPWFLTFNYLDHYLPGKDGTKLEKMSRNAVNGLASSAVSDVVSNSLRVLKTYRQTSSEPISYGNAARNIIASDGLSGLFFRGLGTRVIAHGINGIVFTVVWKYLEEEYNKGDKEE
jgi:hypothetical protein